MHELPGILEACPRNTRSEEAGSYCDLYPDTRKQLRACYAKLDHELTRLPGEGFNWQ